MSTIDSLQIVYGPYPGIVTDWHDGDTCHVNLDLGFGIFLYGHDLYGKPQWSCRVYGINAPELSTDAGKVALAYAQSLCPPQTKVWVMSLGFDKYGGRFDGRVQLPDGSDFGTAMIASGNAVAYS